MKNTYYQSALYAVLSQQTPKSVGYRWPCPTAERAGGQTEGVLGVAFLTSLTKRFLKHLPLQCFGSL